MANALSVVRVTNFVAPASWACSHVFVTSLLLLWNTPLSCSQVPVHARQMASTTLFFLIRGLHTLAVVALMMKFSRSSPRRLLFCSWRKTLVRDVFLFLQLWSRGMIGSRCRSGSRATWTFLSCAFPLRCRSRGGVSCSPCRDLEEECALVSLFICGSAPDTGARAAPHDWVPARCCRAHMLWRNRSVNKFAKPPKVNAVQTLETSLLNRWDSSGAKCFLHINFWVTIALRCVDTRQYYVSVWMIFLVNLIIMITDPCYDFFV